ncbi:MAG TPA: adenylate kinase [Gemmatimonadaceae bacterium]|nr:adenylate kinase [Gemmatimonadaceae bacterium]
MVIVLFGKPGAGKGTQAPKIAESLGVPTLATGNVLRAAVKEGTTLGREAKGYMDRGDLVPDSVILGIVRDELAKSDYARGVVLDGVVRTVPQAQGLASMLSSLGRKVDAVVSLEVPDEEIVRRMGTRTVCSTCQTPYSNLPPGAKCPNCGGVVMRRSDDEPEAVRNRLNVFTAQTAPVFDWYKRNGARIAVVDANGTVGDVTQRVLRALGR